MNSHSCSHSTSRVGSPFSPSASVKTTGTSTSAITNRQAYFGDNSRSTFFAKYKLLSKQSSSYSEQDVKLIQTVNNTLDTYKQSSSLSSLSSLPPIKTHRNLLCDDLTDKSILFLTQISKHDSEIIDEGDRNDDPKNYNDDGDNHAAAAVAADEDNDISAQIDLDLDSVMDSHADAM